ncbi:unnamed protein product, partial [Cylicostephanus goldi]
AIRLANANFDTAQHRPNARKVIVIIASAFQSGRQNDPVTAASTFKEDGGVIITIEYVQTHGAPVPMLDVLASPGYALTNRYGKLHVWSLHKLFCRDCVVANVSHPWIAQFTIDQKVDVLPMYGVTCSYS